MKQQSRDLEFLDLAVLVAGRLRILVGTSIIGAMLAVGVAVSLPKYYASEAVVLLPRINPVVGVSAGLLVESSQSTADAVKIMLSPVVLDEVILKTDPDQKLPVAQARKRLLANVQVRPSLDQLVVLKVTAPSPQLAKAQADALLDAWLATAGPSQKQREYFEELRAQTQASLGVVNHLVDRLIAEQPSHARNEGRHVDGGSSLAMALDTQAQLQRQAFVLSGAMTGLTRDVVKQAPTLPSDPENTSLGLFGVLGALLGGGLALLWVVLMDAWRRSSVASAFSERLKLLRSSDKSH